MSSSSYISFKNNEQANYCSLLMGKIKSHLSDRESVRCNLNTFPYDLPQQLTKTAIQREITELRAALLELSKMLEG